MSRTAVVFDVDGTLVDSERDGHRVAFNLAFDEAGMPHRWGPREYGRLLGVTGGRRRIEADLVTRGWSQDSARRAAIHLHARKTTFFVDMVHQGQVPARPGVSSLLAQLEACGVDLHVVTTGSRDWVVPLLDGLFGVRRFHQIVTGDQVTRLKPHPEAYLHLLARTGLRPHDVVAVEDSAAGVASAGGAGIACLMVTNHYTTDHAPGAAFRVVPGFAGLVPADLLTAPLLPELVPDSGAR